MENSQKREETRYFFCTRLDNRNFITQSKAIDNILHCLDHGCQLGWLIDPDERSIFVFQPNKSLKNYKIDSTEKLPVLEAIDLNLTVSQIFGWLKQNPLKD